MSDSRLGEIRYNTFGTPMRIVKIKDNYIVEIEFLDLHNVHKDVLYQNFISGSIKNPYDRNVRGVGYYGEGEYKSVDKNNPYVKKAFKYGVRCLIDAIEKKIEACFHHMRIVWYVTNGIIIKTLESGMI